MPAKNFNVYNRSTNFQIDSGPKLAWSKKAYIKDFFIDA